MAEATIPVDLRNPGQVFACLGLMEAAEMLFPEAEVTGGYEWDEGSAAARFTLAAEGAEADPIAEAINFLREARAEALMHDGAVSSKSSWRIVERAGETKFSIAKPNAPDKSGEQKPNPGLPAILVTSRGELPISYWADGPHVGRPSSPAPCWVGRA